MTLADVTLREVLIMDAFETKTVALQERVSALEKAVCGIIDAIEADGMQQGPKTRTAVLIGMGLTF